MRRNSIPAGSTTIATVAPTTDDTIRPPITAFKSTGSIHSSVNEKNMLAPPLRRYSTSYASSPVSNYHSIIY